MDFALTPELRELQQRTRAFIRDRKGLRKFQDHTGMADRTGRSCSRFRAQSAWNSSGG